MKTPLLLLCLLAAPPVLAQAPAETLAPADAPRSELTEDIRSVDSQVQRLDPQGRLTSEQLFSLLQQRERRRSGDTREDPGPYIVTVSLFMFVLFGWLGWLLAAQRRAYHLHQTVRLMVEKGAEIPGALLGPPERKPSDLRRGILLSTTGLGLTFFLAALQDAQGAWGAGLTLLLLGLGHVLLWRLQRTGGPLASELSPGRHA